MRDFRLQFDPAGTFTLAGEGWPPMAGTMDDQRAARSRCRTIRARRSATAPRRYRFSRRRSSVGLDVVADECQVAA